MKKFLLVLGLAVVLWIPRATSAANSPCTAAGGACQQGCSAPILDLGALDCSSAHTCCLPLPAASTSCTGNGGHCAAGCSANETDLGSMDCPGIYYCCKLPTTAPATAPGKTSATPGSVGGGGTSPAGAIALPSCIDSGNCSVNDIVQTGVNFATFLMGLSGALFFMIFIYGGALYLTSFGEKSKVDKGKKAIIGAAIGIVIVMGAWTIVQYIVKGITGVGGGASTPAAGQTSTPNDCSTAFPGYSCMTFSDANNKSDLLAKCQAGNDCKPGHCSGQFDICAKSK